MPAGFLHDEWLALYGGALGVVHLTEEKLSDYRIRSTNTLGLRGIGLKAVMADSAADAIRLRAAKVQRLRSLQERLDQSPGTDLDDALPCWARRSPTFRPDKRSRKGASIGSTAWWPNSYRAVTAATQVER